MICEYSALLDLPSRNPRNFSLFSQRSPGKHAKVKLSHKFLKHTANTG